MLEYVSKKNTKYKKKCIYMKYEAAALVPQRSFQSSPSPLALSNGALHRIQHARVLKFLRFFQSKLAN